MRTIEERLVRLERSARRWRAAALGLIALAAAGLLMGQIRMGGPGGGINAPAISANRLSGDRVVVPQNVVDKDGNAKTIDAVMLSLDAGNPCVALSDKTGATRLALKLDGDGNPSLTLLDAKGTALATLAPDAKGAMKLVIADGAGKQVFSAPR